MVILLEVLPLALLGAVVGALLAELLVLLGTLLVGAVCGGGDKPKREGSEACSVKVRWGDGAGMMGLGWRGWGWRALWVLGLFGLGHSQIAPSFDFLRLLACGLALPSLPLDPLQLPYLPEIELD